MNFSFADAQNQRVSSCDKQPSLLFMPSSSLLQRDIIINEENSKHNGAETPSL